VPVVGSDVVGIKELLGKNERGILVPPRDPEALAKAIIRMAQDDGTRERLGSLGKEQVRKHYSMAGMCQKYENFLNQLAMEAKSKS
jgi:glycosyltransferase involved in cell wall biosynthesis